MRIFKRQFFYYKDDSCIELTAQILWSSVFGLIIRLIIEKDSTEEQRHKLIEYHIDFIINGLSSKDKGEMYNGI